MGSIMRALLVALLVTLLACAPAYAKDQSKPTHDEAAAMVRKALAAGDTAALDALVERDDPECFEIVDTLLAQGEGEAAIAFGRRFSEALGAYAEKHARSKTYGVGRDVLAKGNAAREAGDAEALLSVLAALPEGAPPVLKVRVLRAQAGTLMQLRRMAEAAAACRKGAEIAEAIRWMDPAWRLWRNCGLLHSRLGQFAEAEDAWKRELALREGWGSELDRAGLLGNLANLRSQKGDLQGALEMFQQAAKVIEASGNASMHARILNGLANSYADLGQSERARETYERSLAVARTSGDGHAVAWPAYGLGNMATTANDPLAAEPYYAEALKAFEQADDLRGQALTLRGMGRNALMLGDAALARTLAERSLELRKRVGDANGMARSSALLALALRELGDMEHAIEAARQARALAAQVDSFDLHMFVGECLARTYLDAGRPVEGLEAAEAMLARAKAVGHPMALATAYNMVAPMHANSGDHARAVEMIRKAIAIWQAAGDTHAVERSRGNFALLLAQAGELELAATQYELALEAARRAGAPMPVAAVHFGMAIHAFRMRTYAKAEPHLREALAIYEKAENPALVAGVTTMLAEVVLRAGKHDEGLVLATRGLEAARESQALDRIAAALGVMVAAHMARGEPAKAIAYAEEGVAALEPMLAGMSATQGAAARDKYESAYVWGLEAALVLKDPARAFHLMEHATAVGLRAALDARSMLAEHLVPEPLRAADARARAAEARAFETYRSVARRRDRVRMRKARAALDEARAERRAVVERIQREAQRASGLLYPKPDTLATVQAELAPTEALVSYRLWDTVAVAVVATREKAWLVDLGAGTALDERIRACRLEAQPHIDAGKVAALIPALVEPLGLPAGAARVLVVPAGPMSQLPMGLLFPDREVVRIPSATHWRGLRREEATGTSVLALGDPDYGGRTRPGSQRGGVALRLAPLPATRKEAEAVGDTALLGAEATEQGFRKALGQRTRWRAIHFACHGLVDLERPSYSSLALTGGAGDDGFLSCLDIFRLDVPADLVVLSACESSRGKVFSQEGVFGLPSAFLYAGARSVLASLWKVDDEATQALMLEFYRRWNPKEGKGVSAPQALKAAQAHVRAQAKWADPYYWAAWVLWGTPD